MNQQQVLMQGQLPPNLLPLVAQGMQGQLPQGMHGLAPYVQQLPGQVKPEQQPAGAQANNVDLNHL